MFGLGKKRTTAAEARAALVRLTEEKCQQELEACHKLEDPAARYLAFAEFRAARERDIDALDRELEKKRESRNFYKALGIMAPFSVAFCLTHPAGWAVMGVLKMAGSGLMMLSPAGPISDSLNKNGAGRKRLRAEMAALYAPLRDSKAAASAEMSRIAHRRSPKRPVSSRMMAGRSGGFE